ncbi:hypothetical protein L202_06397 [Cryptococcus amylolentus CBS 6039]|uniref:MARVEL domain-containing protein n=2 Tax=Cryptococcus amylolentus TaxID=104669 RepID=A0A1E3HFT6_9TREE|nr:hypothetical protein L202_06397 [Cryptococcus amylolentus CBS 6039]ODN75200.1 hypothetical protein L202_06397 [Cryptococcus amylolentus CBS 6039]ODO02981.1 hypothetical protein I350_05824 [Cryptococcus amylolentus CBS 6273]
MSFIPLLTTGLKVFACFWALITFSVAAAFVSKANDFFGSSYVQATKLTAGNAIIAAGVLAFLYLIAVLVLTVASPNNIFISVMLDAVFLGGLFIFFLGSAAALSTLAALARRFDMYTWAKLGEATLGLAWVMTFLLLGILVLEVAYTLTHFGGGYATWRTPFNQLVAYGTGAHTKHHTPAAPMATASHAPTATTGTHPPGSHISPGVGTNVNEHNYELAPPQPREAGVTRLGTVNPTAANRV